MKTKILLSVIVSTVLLLVPYAFAQRAGQGNSALAKFQNALKQDGFDVSSGTTTVFNPVADWCAGTPSPGMGDTAFYSNNQPYLQFVVPNPAEDSDLPTGFFRLGPAEAIVLIGLTPPPERYFGFYPVLRKKAPKLPLFATLGDAVNNLTIKTTGTTPFNSPVVLIFTPDQGTDARIRAALERAGYPETIINTVVFPASMLNLGHGDTADQLNITMRNAIWEKGAEADGDAYILNPPLSLFRVTPRTETIANPFPAPRLRVRGTGKTEMDLMNKLGLLRQRIVEDNPGLYATDMVIGPPASYEAYDYIQRGVDPMGDSRDALFLGAGFTPEYGSEVKVTLADNEFLMFYGANHVATGKATYHGVYVYSGKDEGEVPLGSVDDRKFQDSATPYLPDDPAAKLMYAYKFSRNCGTESNCAPLDSGYCPALQLGENTVLSFWVRMYLEPATKVGPAMQEILYDHVIKFSPRQPQPPQP